MVAGARVGAWGRPAQRRPEIRARVGDVALAAEAIVIARHVERHRVTGLVAALVGLGLGLVGEHVERRAVAVAAGLVVNELVTAQDLATVVGGPT